MIELVRHGRELGQSMDKQESFRGYELVNPSFTNAAIALLENLHLAHGLSLGQTVDLATLLHSAPKPRYLQTVIDWLIIQGLLETTGEGLEYRATAEGIEVFERAPVICRVASTYTKIKDAMKWETGISPEFEGVDLDKFTHGYWRTSNFVPAIVPAAAAYVHEAHLESGPYAGQTAGAALQQGHKVNLDHFPDFHGKNRSIFIEVLVHSDVLKKENDAFVLTGKGKKLLQIGGYAELSLSYYEVLEKLYDLLQGRDTYGLEGTVYRDPEINAHASNGILTIRVAPYLVNALDNHQLLRESFRGGGAFIDYGSGGGDMLMHAAKEGPPTLKCLYGVDINPRTNEEARRILAREGLEDKISLVTGSIADETTLREVGKQMKAAGIRRGAASINFILHDIGPQLSSRFLNAHARVFPRVPLMITETLRMPMEVCKAHPNYQASSFQFMHDASGQHLYEADELRRLLESSQYEIVSEKVHSSMPDADGSGRLPTIVTWIARAR